jgi:hypothetical protein
MPRVLLSRETDATSFQEKEEALQAFRDTTEVVLGRHHKAFLSMFKQMMEGVFVPGMEQVFSRVSPHAYSEEVGETSSAQPTGAQPPLQSQPIQPPPQSVGSRRSSLLHTALEVSQCNLLYESRGDSQSSHLYKAMQVNQFNSQTHISLHMGRWRSAHLEYRPIPLTR